MQDLTGANLTEATLSGVDLTNSRLMDTQLTRAFLACQHAKTPPVAWSNRERSVGLYSLCSANAGRLGACRNVGAWTAVVTESLSNAEHSHLTGGRICTKR